MPESIDEWRGDLCMALRDMNRDDLADEVGAWGDSKTSLMMENYSSPEIAAQWIVHLSDSERESDG